MNTPIGSPLTDGSPSPSLVQCHLKRALIANPLAMSVGRGTVRHMIGGERLLVPGEIGAGLGGSLGVAYYIYAREAGTTFWGWPGWVAATTTGLGLICVAVGVLARQEGGAAQVQRSGRSSSNYQAGRDIHISGGKREEGND